MSADEFYILFKHGLKCLGVDWGEKHKVQVHLSGKNFVMRNEDLVICIKIRKGKKK
jgi:hypothetical protein